jgi:hypothetical protein
MIASNCQSFRNDEPFIRSEYRSFGASAIGIEWLRDLVAMCDSRILVDGFSNGTVGKYLQSSVSAILCIKSDDSEEIDENIAKQHDYLTLRDYDTKCTRETKKKFKRNILLLNWPDTSGVDYEQIVRFNPEYIIAIIDENGNAGSASLLHFIKERCITRIADTAENPRYIELASIRRECTHISGDSCTVYCTLLRKSFYAGTEVDCLTVDYSPLLLY